MPVPQFAKLDHSEPCTSAADEDAVVLLCDTVVVCKQAGGCSKVLPTYDMVSYPESYVG